MSIFKRRKLAVAVAAAFGAILTAATWSVTCGKTQSGVHGNDTCGITSLLTDSLTRIAAACPGEMGIAVIIDNKDTVTVNNRNIYPMMSVFKLHQALAVCHEFDSEGISLDSIMRIERKQLDANTWSPMLREHEESVIELPIKDLLTYTLTKSDNNASNLLFERITDVPATDSFIATLIPRESFQIAYTESEMSEDHEKAYSNRTSPLGAADLINSLFNDSLISTGKQEFIKDALFMCATGTDRLSAPLKDHADVRIAHKTGSGYTNAQGILAAHNDVGYVLLPDGTHYAIAVFVKDIHADETLASDFISRISEATYNLLKRQ